MHNFGLLLGKVELISKLFAERCKKRTNIGNKIQITNNLVNYFFIV